MEPCRVLMVLDEIFLSAVSTLTSRSRSLCSSWSRRRGSWPHCESFWASAPPSRRASSLACLHRSLSSCSRTPACRSRSPASKAARRPASAVSLCLRAASSARSRSVCSRCSLGRAVQKTYHSWSEKVKVAVKRKKYGLKPRGG